LLADDGLLEGASAASVDVLRHPVRVTLRPDARIAFADAAVDGVDLTIRSDVDRHNLDAVAPGTVLGWLEPSPDWPLYACGADGLDVSAALFACENGRLLTRCELVPVMMTCSADAARGDCLFYALRRR
jgi:hypothetical protein